MNEKEEKKKKRESEVIENDLDDIIRKDDIFLSIFISVFCGLFVWLLATHHVLSTGFYTATFGTMEIIMLYGPFIYWILTSFLLLIGSRIKVIAYSFKNASRNLDSFGGLIFASISFVWLYVVFPFDFAYFADVLPDGFKFLVQWVTNDVERWLLIIGFLIHVIFSYQALKTRMLVLKERSRRAKL